MATKKTVLQILLNLCLYSNSNCQTIFSTKNEVYQSRKIIFYGYDFSDFQLSDPKRMGQDLKKYIFTLTGFFVEHLPEKKLADWLEKDEVIFNFNPTLLVNKKINSEDIGAPIIHKIDKDSLQSLINKYLITEKSGIGYAIIFECFDNASKSISAYSVFFDISTKKILQTKYINRRDGNSYNRLSDWNAASFTTIKKLTDLTIYNVEQNETNVNKVIFKSEDEKLIEKITSDGKFTEINYLNFEEVKIGDIIKFISSYGEAVYGIITNKIGKSTIIFNSYPSIGQPLIWEEKFNNVKLLKKIL